MPAQPRSSARRSAADRRDQLLDVTARLVAEHGFHGLSIETIARSAGVTRGLVYQHFRDLRELLEAVIERETSRALAQVSETALTSLDEGEPLELMLESLRAYLHAVQNQPTTWRLILMPLVGAPRALHAKIAEGRASVLARLSRAVQPALAEDRKLPDAELTARLLSAIADEYARLILTDPEQFPAERLVTHARWWLSQSPLVTRSSAGGSGPPGAHGEPPPAMPPAPSSASAQRVTDGMREKTPDQLVDELIDELLAVASIVGPGDTVAQLTTRLMDRLLQAS